MVPTVTAVITTHRRPLQFREALASLRSEDYRDVECIIVDDTSASSARLHIRATREHPDARVLRGHSLGVGRARNVALAAAKGEFVIFLDDDDVSLPARIATLVAAARQFDADLCFGMTRRVATDGAVSLPAVPTDVLRFGAVGFCDLLTCAPHINAVLARTAMLREVGGFDADADHFDDWSAWLRMADRGARIGCVDEVVAEWRLHPTGLSGMVNQAGAMKARLMELFDRLTVALSEESVEAVVIARQTVATRNIVTYDDYAQAMSDVRASLHASGSCLGRRQSSHDERQSLVRRG